MQAPTSIEESVPPVGLAAVGLDTVALINMCRERR